MQERDALRRKKEEEAQERQKSLRDLQLRCRACMLTHGHTFDGYHISSYHGTVSAATVLNTTVLPPTQPLWEDKEDGLICNDEASHPLAQALSESCQRLAIAVEKAGGNAGIGVKVDYIPYGSNTLAMAASCLAVTAEKD